MPKNTENLKIFEFQMAGSGQNWLADDYAKTSALSRSLSKSVFVSQIQKFMKIFQKNHPPPQKKRPFVGGGVILLNQV